MIADHWDVSQLMSRDEVSAAHGWLAGSVSCARMLRWLYEPTKEHDNGIAFGRNETQHEDVLATTIIA